MEPLISVIVPVYKVERYLSKCIDSILNQTYKNLEIILVDDGSPDCCGDLCDRYAQKDRRIVVVHQENKGLSQARNTGLEMFKGEYLMFVDSDDYLHQDAVRTLYQRITADKSDMAVGNAVCVDGEGMILGEPYTTVLDGCISRQEAYEEFGGSHRIPCMAWAKLYKDAIYHEIRFPVQKTAEDLWVITDVIDRCEKISLCSSVIYFYAQRPFSIMTDMNDDRILDQVSSNIRVAKKMLDRGYDQAAGSYYTSAIYRATRMKDPARGRRMIRETFPVYRRLTLLKHDIHSVLRYAALYLPMLHIFLAKRRNRK